MEFLRGFKRIVLIQWILFLVPVNVFLIGEGIAAGVQWILFRYLQSAQGTSLIYFISDIAFVVNGIVTGRSAVALMVNAFASVLMVLAAILVLYAVSDYNSRGPACWIKRTAIISLCGAALFLISDMIQYGIFLYGPAGFVIPLGLPVVIISGLWMYWIAVKEEELQSTSSQQSPGQDQEQ